ncbi:MAG: SOS response-associated peptidase family protein [Pseudomonadota bacterium]
MCGRFNIIDSPEVRRLLRILNVTPEGMHWSGDVSPGSHISMVSENGTGRAIRDATWWLLLDHDTLKPSRYTSFNTRSDRLHTPRSAGYRPYRQSRCIIPASAFIEGLGDRQTYHKIELEGQAIAFGGLYREYVNRETGETATGASIITLPPPAEWKEIHPKSMPLMLPVEDTATLDAWLDPGVQDVERFDALLQPRIAMDQLLTPIDRPSRWNERGRTFRISASPPSRTH